VIFNRRLNAMTSPNTPTDEQLENTDPTRDQTVVREDDEGVTLRLNTVTAEAVEETSARTYTRSFGHYFISDDSRATEVLDEFFANFSTDYSVLDSFQRNIGESYEVVVEADGDLQETNYTFNNSQSAVIQLPSHSEYVEDVDEFLSVVESEVQD
jgi:hypothetical protein